ncbi:MAG: EAL domain-containing protein, partial [Bacillota bacterium]|nr:EAL domain-containing protein [Bacillota bacterium]
ENGKEALDILKDNKDSVSLILLDVMMPVMDGYTFLDIAKNDPALALIPVIVTTQSSSEEEEVAAMSHGATDFVPKPYRPKVILHRVAGLIRLRETAAMVNQFKYDRLTGLYSKEYFFEMVKKQLADNPEKEYSIVCSDIDNFKLYNDVFGRAAGDILLKEIASIIKKSVGSTGFCARFDADRFICLQEKEKERADRNNFSTGEENKLTAMKGISMRWGIYEITDKSFSVDAMCDRAMLAVNSIKGNYNEFFAVYDDSLRKKLLREKEITESIEPAMEEGQIVFYLQPKYSLKDNCLAGAEALVRWVHPDWGFMSPGEFVPIFEKNGFISKLDKYIWEKVCEQLRIWKDKGMPPVAVSVNVSRADVFHMNLAEVIPEMADRYGIDPSLLHLEITESAYAEDFGQIMDTVNRLRKMGFVVEMDDFGSGFSSLNMLSRITLDILKLDMKFIQNEIAKSADHSILNDVISMAQRMNMKVVAEGVESREQMNRLREVGCDFAQGYYFAKPMPVAEFEELLLKQKPRITKPAPVRNTKDKHTFLVVDENSAYREHVRRYFNKKYNVLAAADADEALRYMKDEKNLPVSAVIMSLTLPKGESAAMLKEMRQGAEFWDTVILGTLPDGAAVDNLPLAMETDDFMCKLHPLSDMEKRIRRMLEIEDYRERIRTLTDEDSKDYMTGLLNRRGLKVAIDSLRRDEMPMALCLFDLDGLNNINSTCGHDEGDRVIGYFSELLRRRTRTSDIQCRYGGDEFVLILKNLNNEETPLRKCTEICDAFAEYAINAELNASCTAGIVMCGINERPSHKLIEKAEKALHRAKAEKPGGCIMYENK